MLQCHHIDEVSNEEIECKWCRVSLTEMEYRDIEEEHMPEIKPLAYKVELASWELNERDLFQNYSRRHTTEHAKLNELQVELGRLKGLHEKDRAMVIDPLRRYSDTDRLMFPMSIVVRL